MQRLPYPTPYPDVNALIDTLHQGARAALGHQFLGMYLHGSLAGGDFDPQRSDIDFAVVTRDGISPAQYDRLEAMHARIATGDLKWKQNYEGSYIPAAAIRRYDPAQCLHPVIRCDGSFGLNEHRSEWVIQRHVLREHGIVVAGPLPETLIDPITSDDLRLATRRLLHEWWKPMLQRPVPLQDSEYQAYAVLTMCRALYTLQTGAVASKPWAAGWAKQNLGARWAPLIDVARSWRHGVELDCLEGALELISYTLTQC